MYRDNTPTTSNSKVRWIMGEHIEGENKVHATYSLISIGEIPKIKKTENPLPYIPTPIETRCVR